MHLESVCVSPALHFVAMDMPFLDTGCNLFSLSAVLFSFRTHDQPLNQGSISPILQRERSNSKTYQISNLTDQPFTPFSGSLLNLASGSRSTNNPTPILHNLVQPSQSFIPYSNFRPRRRSFFPSPAPHRTPHSRRFTLGRRRSRRRSSACRTACPFTFATPSSTTARSPCGTASSRERRPCACPCSRPRRSPRVPSWVRASVGSDD